MKEGVSKFSPSFLCPKPRLSQAGALLLPKDFVSLEAVLISFDKFVKHDLDECNLYHSFCGFSKEFIIDGQPSEVFQP